MTFICYCSLNWLSMLNIKKITPKPINHRQTQSTKKSSVGCKIENTQLYFKKVSAVAIPKKWCYIDCLQWQNKVQYLSTYWDIFESLCILLLVKFYFCLLGTGYFKLLSFTNIQFEEPLICEPNEFLRIALEMSGFWICWSATSSCTRPRISG